jgi:hypothetical protein
MAKREGFGWGGAPVVLPEDMVGWLSPGSEKKSLTPCCEKCQRTHCGSQGDRLECPVHGFQGFVRPDERRQR